MDEKAMDACEGETETESGKRTQSVTGNEIYPR